MNRRQYEINAVKRLGEEIGYGNMMDIAQALWAMKLSDKETLRTGHIVTVEPCVKKKEISEIHEHIKGRIGEIEWSLSHDEDIAEYFLRTLKEQNKK